MDIEIKLPENTTQSDLHTIARISARNKWNTTLLTPWNVFVSWKTLCGGGPGTGDVIEKLFGMTMKLDNTSGEIK